MSSGEKLCVFSQLFASLACEFQNTHDTTFVSPFIFNNVNIKYSETFTTRHIALRRQDTKTNDGKTAFCVEKSIFLSNAFLKRVRALPHRF